MPDPHKMDNEKSVYLDREEHMHRGELGAKRVVLYTYDSNTDTLIPSSSSSSGTARLSKVSNRTVITSSTSEATVLAAGASGVYRDVYGVVVTNTSSTATEVDFRDDTAGTIRFTVSAPANDTRGFMLPAADGHNQSATAKPWTATCADSVASVVITILAKESA